MEIELAFESQSFIDGRRINKDLVYHDLDSIIKKQTSMSALLSLSREGYVACL